MATVNEDLLDAAIRHQVGLHRYTKGQIKKIVSLLNKTEARLVEQITKFDPLDSDGSWTKKRLDRLLVAIRDTQAEAYALINDQMNADLQEFAAYEAQFTANAVGRYLPISFDIVTPSSEQLWAAVNARPFNGKYLKEWGSELEESAFRRVRDTVRQGYVEGRTTDQIIRDIVGTRANQYQDGIIETNRKSVAMMVRTATNHTATVARQKTYENNADIVKGWRFVATLDGHTSVTCMSLDGTEWPIGEGPIPPRHPNCRSADVPITKSWKELGIDVDELDPVGRASMDGQVPGTESYNSWLGKQDGAFQDDVLGKTRAELFRSGGLTLDKFTDKMGEEYTLAELRRREADAFEKAGL